MSSVLSTLDSFMQQPHSIIILVSSMVSRDEKKITSNTLDLNNSMTRMLGKVLGINDAGQIDIDKKLKTYGVDSLLTFELRHVLDKYFNVTLILDKIPEMTIRQLQELTNKI